MDSLHRDRILGHVTERDHGRIRFRRVIQAERIAGIQNFFFRRQQAVMTHEGKFVVHQSGIQSSYKRAIDGRCECEKQHARTHAAESASLGVLQQVHERLSHFACLVRRFFQILDQGVITQYRDSFVHHTNVDNKGRSEMSSKAEMIHTGRPVWAGYRRRGLVSMRIFQTAGDHIPAEKTLETNTSCNSK